VYNSLILTAHCASSQAPRRRRLSRVFHGRLLHFMSISAHFRVLWACTRVMGVCTRPRSAFRAPRRSSLNS
jgi:hypothetical protein